MEPIQKSILAQLQSRNESFFDNYSTLLRSYNDLYLKFLQANSNSVTEQSSRNSFSASFHGDRLNQETIHLKMRLNEALIENSDKTKLVDSLQREVAKMKKEEEQLADACSHLCAERNSLKLVNKELNTLLCKNEDKVLELLEDKKKMETLVVNLTTEKDRYFSEVLKMKEELAVKMNQLNNLEQALDSEKKQFEGEIVFLRKENENFRKSRNSSSKESPTNNPSPLSIKRSQTQVIQEPHIEENKGGSFSMFKIFTRNTGGSTSSIGIGGTSSMFLNELYDVRSLYQHEKSVNFLKVSPKGDLLASGGDEGVIKVFNILGESEKSSLMNTRYDQIFTCADMSMVDPDSMVTGDTSRKITYWSIVQGRAKQTMNIHSDKVNCVIFKGNERNKIASGANDMSMKLSDVSKGTVLKTFAPGSSTLALATDYALIYSVHSDGSLKFWSETKGFPIHNEADYHHGKITCLQQSNDSNYLATSDKNGVIQVYDLRMQKKLHHISNNGYYNSFDKSQVVFSPDDSKLVAGGGDGTIFVWDISSRPVLVAKHQTRISSSMHSICLSSISNSLFGSTSAGHVIAMDFR